MPRITVDVVEEIKRGYDQLDTLDLAGNYIPCVENLEELRSLRKLNLSHNDIQVLENVQELTNLEELYVRDNKM